MNINYTYNIPIYLIIYNNIKIRIESLIWYIDFLNRLN